MQRAVYRSPLESCRGSLARRAENRKHVQMTNKLLDTARDLYPMIDANAVAAGNDPVPDDTVRALLDAGLYGVLVPREAGGAGLSVADAIDVIAEVSRADGSTGWCLMAGAGVVSFFGAYAGEDFVARMFAEGVPPMAFGAPTTGFGTGRREGDGYRVSGRFGFGSGRRGRCRIGSRRDVVSRVAFAPVVRQHVLTLSEQAHDLS